MFNKLLKLLPKSAMCLMLGILCLTVPALAEEPVTQADLAAAAGNLNIVWTLVAAILVFFMQAGFAMVEAGFTRAKNAVNILMKNLMDFSIGSLAFFLIGFGLIVTATERWTT